MSATGSFHAGGEGQGLAEAAAEQESASTSTASAHAVSPVSASAAVALNGWSVSLNYSGTSSLTFVATANQSVSSTGMWISIYDISYVNGPKSVAHCTSGSTCSGTGVPSETESTYVAVVAPAYTGSGMPPSAQATSNSVTPPAWTISLAAEVGTTVRLTATTNYSTANSGLWINLFDTAGTGNINRLTYCNEGTTCAVTAVPEEVDARYVAVVMASIPNKYPTSGAVAISNAVIPPPWTVSLSSSGPTLTATTNYDLTNSGFFVEIFDQSSTRLRTYLGWCTTGLSCSKATSYSGHTFIATVGSVSNTFAPDPLLAVSNQVGNAGPTGPYETAGGSNPAELCQVFSCQGDPVNTSNGEFFESDTDLSVPGRGPGLLMARTYSSQRSSFSGPLGYGWSFAFDMHITQPTPTSAEVTHENGSVNRFTQDAPGVYSAASWVMASLSRNPDLTWTLTRRAREVFDFDTEGHLVRISDLNGNGVTLTRDGADRVTAVTDGAGRALTFSYDGARLAAAMDPVGQVVSYAYDATGRLTTVTAPGGAVTQYGYGATNLLTTITDPYGNVVTNSYDKANRVTSQVDRLGGTTTFAYEADGTTTTTSPGGRVTKETYVAGQLLTIIKGAGTPEAQTWTYVHDPVTYGTTKVTDPLGHSITATYDTAGNRLTATDPNGHTSSWTYNGLNETTSGSDALGTTTTFTYDSAGNLLKKSTPLAGTTDVATVTYSHSDPGHPGDVTAVTNPDGNTTTYAYDDFGNRTTATDPLGDTKTSSFDMIGRPTATTTAGGNTTTISYNPAGQLGSVTDPLDNTTVFTYDLLGRRTAVTNAQGHTATTTFDAAGRPTSTTNPGGATSTNTYDLDGNRTSVTDASGQTTNYAYDSLNRLESATDPLGRATAYSYDAVGRLATVTDPTGKTTTTTYDPAGNRATISYSDGTTPSAAFTYTASNQLDTMTDGSGTTANDYDSLGRLTAQTNGNGQSIVYAYDLAGHLTALTYPNGQAITRDYDDAGRLVSVTDWLGHATTFTRDEDGNAASTTYGNGVTATATFDDAGRMSTIADTGPGGANLASITYTRNAIGGLTSTTTTGLSASTENYTYTDREQLATVNAGEYSYDNAGNITSLATGSSLTYDVANQPTSLTVAGATTSISTDSNGNRLAGPGVNGSTVTYVYDQANRLIGADGATYTYNADGLRATKETSAGAAQQFAWDGRSSIPLMLTDGATNYLYDDANIPIEQIDSTGATMYYQQDQYGSTRLLTNDEGSAGATYSYDPYGNLTAKSGTEDTPLRWNGQNQDADTGLYYLRARYYDPQTAQFITKDPLAYITQALYAYAENNPLNAMDPLGLWSWNPLEWTGQEWDTVGAVAGVVALTTAIIGATVVTGGAAAAVLTAVAITANATSLGVSVGGVVVNCGIEPSAECGNSVGGAALSAVGWGFGGRLLGTAWKSRHVAQNARVQARLEWMATNFSGPAYDAFGYVRKYC